VEVNGTRETLGLEILRRKSETELGPVLFSSCSWSPESCRLGPVAREGDPRSDHEARPHSGARHPASANRSNTRGSLTLAIIDHVLFVTDLTRRGDVAS
jgi:hypothetical protein